jgi:phosphatidylglycerol---prolipoprotein diacylglyceryl transferase
MCLRGQSYPQVGFIHFPVYFRVNGISFHPHFVMEFLAYAAAFQIYLALKRKFSDVIAPAERWQVIGAAAFGAALGSRLLGWIENPLAAWHAGLIGGKTIIGAIGGAWIAVEAAKSKMGVRVRTGDLLAIPLALGIAIGRVGCFLTGLSDDTYGTVTALPWGVDFGDGIRRHPTQLYEIIFLVFFSGVLWRSLKAVNAGILQTGDVFRLFILGYASWRLAIDFLKPEPRILGLSMIQWACVAGLAYCSKDAARMANTWRRFLGNSSALTERSEE